MYSTKAKWLVTKPTMIGSWLQVALGKHLRELFQTQIWLLVENCAKVDYSERVTACQKSELFLDMLLDCSIYFS